MTTVIFFFKNALFGKNVYLIFSFISQTQILAECCSTIVSRPTTSWRGNKCKLTSHVVQGKFCRNQNIIFFVFIIIIILFYFFFIDLLFTFNHPWLHMWVLYRKKKYVKIMISYEKNDMLWMILETQFQIFSFWRCFPNRITSL